MTASEINPVVTPRVVLVDVRPERRNVMRSMIELATGVGSVVAQVANATEALAATDRHQADTAVIEVQLPLVDGLAVIAALRLAHPSMMIVVCTFDGSRLAQQQAKEAGADTYLVKPVSVRELRAVLGAERLVPLVAVAP